MISLLLQHSRRLLLKQLLLRYRCCRRLLQGVGGRIRQAAAANGVELSTDLSRQVSSMHLVVGVQVQVKAAGCGATAAASAVGRKHAAAGVAGAAQPEGLLHPGGRRGWAGDQAGLLLTGIGLAHPNMHA